MPNERLEIGQPLPSRTHCAGTVQLFLYNAAIWNPHRIHYDLPYTRDREDHPALLVDGPLQGDWLTQLAYEWMNEGDALVRFDYSNRRPAYVDEALVAEGEVAAVDGNRVTLALRVVNPRGDITTQARAVVRRSG